MIGAVAFFISLRRTDKSKTYDILISLFHLSIHICQLQMFFFDIILDMSLNIPRGKLPILI